VAGLRGDCLVYIYVFGTDSNFCFEMVLFFVIRAFTDVEYQSLWGCVQGLCSI
jgi:hypothetical protein